MILGAGSIPRELMYLLVLSRPKNLNEVSAQDHTVAVLKKTLESANVRCVLHDHYIAPVHSS